MSRPRSFVVRLARGVLWFIAAVAILVALGFRRDRPVAEVEARRGGPPSKFAVVDGLRTHYRDRGTGPVVVLVHGSNSSLLTWEGWRRCWRATIG